MEGIEFQSTRPCGARLTGFRCRGGVFAVSIHAPVRGATEVGQKIRRSFAVSIHAPVRGATTEAHAGALLMHVSIHAPVRGATTGGRQMRTLLEFQSTRPCGARLQLPDGIA